MEISNAKFASEDEGLRELARRSQNYLDMKI